MNRMLSQDVAYMAGIFDGEGWFTCNTNVFAAIAMTDYDIVQKLHDKAGIGRLNEHIFTGKKNQLQWTIAKYDEVEEFIHAILPFLSERRTARAQEVLDSITERRAKAEWRETHFICGHDKTEENTYHFRTADRTACKTCVQEKGKARYAANKLAASIS